MPPGRVDLHLPFTCVPFMEELDACLKTRERAKNQPFGELRIGAPVEFGKVYFPAITAAFREQYTDVTVYLKLGDAGTLLPMVEKGHGQSVMEKTVVSMV